MSIVVGQSLPLGEQHVASRHPHAEVWPRRKRRRLLLERAAARVPGVPGGPARERDGHLQVVVVAARSIVVNSVPPLPPSNSG